MEQQTRAPRTGRRAAAAGLAAAALAWLAGTLVSAHVTIAAETGAVALTAAAYALPGVVAAALVAGAAAAMVALWAWDPAAVRSVTARCAAALAAGVLVGGAAAAAFLAAAPTAPHRTLVAATLAAAATIGGALGWSRAHPVVGAGLAAALAAFAVGWGLSLAKGPVQGFLGDDGGPVGRIAAEGRFAILSAVLSAVAAGVVAFGWLGRRGGHWSRYLLAGATPGLVLLLGEVVVRVGGGSLVTMTRNISDADATLQGWLDGSRLNNALVVLFLGAITALLCAGRTLPRVVASD